ncbi:MAG: hypothetical protein Q9213_006410 [Squamulea squamosa]
MASILFAGSVLAYEKFKESKAKRAARKAEHASRFSELEKENQKRIEALQKNTCFCSTSDWQGGGCPVHSAGSRDEDTEDGAMRCDNGNTYGYGDTQTSQADDETQPPSYPEGQGLAREDTIAMTGTTENEIIDSYRNDQVSRDGEGDLMVPDVSQVVPLQYEEVRMRKGGGPCKKSLKERVLRRKVECGEREVVR